MSKGEFLYFKGMQIPISEESEDEDMWDDSKLTAAYDKAVSMANAEVARRIAMSTNNRSKTDLKKETPDGSKQSKSNSKSSKHTLSHTHEESATKWKAGMACSAVYDCDKQEYEAFVLRIINDNECIVRFLGYENSEVVAISSLKPSLGKEARAKQIREALDFNCQPEPPQDVLEMMTQRNEEMDVESDKTHSAVSDDSHHRKKKSKKKKHNCNGAEIPKDFPTSFPMTALADFVNEGIPEMGIPPPPPPPPPPALLQGAAPGEQQALSAMLLSWYMSGYCTGYYQGITRSKQSKRKQ